MRGLFIALCLLAAMAVTPAAATAETYTVNSTADTGDADYWDGICRDDAGRCTLRGALEQAYDWYGGPDDEVIFDASFDGGPEDEIFIGRPIWVPPWTRVDGGSCPVAGSSGPCVWVGYASPSAQTALEVGYESAVLRMAIGNAGTAIGPPSSDPASGVRISGNWLGLGLDGSPTPVDVGVSIPGGGNAMIGGPNAEDGNRIAARRIALLLGAGQFYADFTVQNNWIGLDPETFATTIRPSAAGIFINGSGDVWANRVAVAGGPAVYALGYSRARDNWIGVAPNGAPVGGGSVGIHGGVDQFSGGLDAVGNVIGNVNGPAIRADGYSRIYGNLIGVDPFGRAHPNAGPGMRFAASQWGSNSMVGLDHRHDHAPNVISNSRGPAIEVARGTSGLMIGPNWGTGNSGQFIDLGTDGPGNPSGVNDGISPPRVKGASPTVIHGWAERHAEVNVYLSRSGNPGDLNSLLGVADAGRTGHWQLVLPTPLAPNAHVAVSQWSRGLPRGGSELVMRRVDARPPASEIKITHRPGRRVVIRLSADEPASFSCAVDKGPLKPCAGTRRMRLPKGRHRVRAVGTDSSGNVEATPSRVVFRVSG